MSTGAVSGSKVPFALKLAWGFGMLANQMFPAALGVFLVVLVQNLGFSPLLWGVIFFAPRLFDAITDPVMGFISDNTRSKWGRRRQYIFIGAIILGLSYMAMWQLYAENGVTFNFIYFMGLSLVFYLGLTIFSVPFVAMGYEMSEDFHERTNIMAIGQFVGQWAWVIAPWFWVILYDTAWFPDAASGVRELSIWVGVGCGILAMIPAIFIKQQSTVDREDLAPVSLATMGDSLKEIAKATADAFRIKQFRQIAFATFLIFNSFNVIATFTFFIILHYLFGSDEAAVGIWPAMHGSVGALVTTFLVIPVVAWVSKYLGKKKTFIISQAISVVGYILFWFLFVPGKPYLFLWALPFHSFGIGGLFTLMMSMTADVCDIDEYNTSRRREGTLGAVYWWMTKFGQAFAGLLSGVIMAMVGFDAANVTIDAMTGLRLFYTFLPIAGVVGAIAIMWNYDITEEKANEVRKALADRAASNSATSS
jgi:GPH family glycoside/pentoside/hexuronide:cation symporter